MIQQQPQTSAIDSYISNLWFPSVTNNNTVGHVGSSTTSRDTAVQPSNVTSTSLPSSTQRHSQQRKTPLTPYHSQQMTEQELVYHQQHLAKQQLQKNFHSQTQSSPQLSSSNYHESLLHTFNHRAQTNAPNSDFYWNNESTSAVMNNNHASVHTNNSNGGVTHNTSTPLSNGHYQQQFQQHQLYKQQQQQNQSNNSGAPQLKEQQQQQQPEMVQKKTNEVETFIFEELFKHLGAHGLDRSQLDTFIEHVSSDGDVLAQFLGCAYDHIYEPDAIIVQEEQNVLKPNQFCLTFRVNLRLLRLRALIVFVCFNLCKLHPDQNECRMWLLEKLKDNVLLLDESLNEVTHASFFDQLRIIEQNLRFETEVQVLQPNSQRNKVHVEVKNGTMNSILLKSSDQDALTASFDQVTLAMQKEKNEDGVSGNSSDEDEDDRCDVLVRPYLLIHIGKYMTFAKYGQNTFKMSSSLASSRPTSSVQEDKDSRLSIVDVSPTKGDANSNTSVRLTWNKEFFVNPKRENTDIYFAVQLGRVKLPRIDALYIDHLKITIPPLQDCYSSSSSSDEEDCASITSAAHIPIQVRHNHLELTTDASFQSIPMESIATSSSSPSPHESFATHHSPSVGNKRTLIHNENSRAMMDDDDIQADLIHDMCGTTISHKRQRLSEDFQDSCSTSDSYTNQSTISNSYKSTTIKSLQKIRDPCGFTLLHSASFRGYTKLVKMLVNVQNFTVDQQDHYLFTPLHWACYSGNVDIAMFLMKNGASPTLQNIFALTAPDIAEEQNHMELWKAMDAELQRQACCALFTLFSASKSEEAPLCSSGVAISATTASNSSSSNHSAATAATACQPATVITKTPKGVEVKAQTMELFIKPSRKKRTYISFFPNELCSSPYKYDILLRIPLHFTNQFNELQFTFHLLIQGSDQQWQRVNQTDAVEVVKYLRTMFPLNYREIEWRIMFRVCSFHFHRKPFKFQVVYNSKLQQHQQIPASVREEQQHLAESAAALQAAANGVAVEIPASSISALTGSREGGDLPSPSVDANCLGVDDSGAQLKNSLCDDCVVFESQPFFIVARKKKKNDFFESM